MKHYKKQMLNQKIFHTSIIILCLLSLPVFLYSCGKKEEAPKAQGVPVNAETLTTKDVEVGTDYVATLISKRSTNIYPRITGPIENIYVKDGDIVKKGTVLMTIEQSAQVATTKSSNAKVQSAKSDVDKAKATLKSYIANKEASKSDLELNKIEFNRYKTLYEQDSATKSDFDTATNNLNKAQSDYDSTLEQIKAQENVLGSSKASYNQAIEDLKEQQSVLSYYNITAPFDGEVGHIPIKIGEYVTSQTLLTSLTEPGSMEVQVGIDSSKKNSLKEGMKVKLTDPIDQKVYPTTIYFVSPKIDEDTQTIIIKSMLEKGTGNFEAGQVVHAKVVWKETKGITVPTTSIMNYAGKKFVYLIDKDNKVSQIPVELGDLQGDEIVIINGLKEGDKIVTSGIQKLRNGSTVTIQK